MTAKVRKESRTEWTEERMEGGKGEGKLGRVYRLLVVPKKAFLICLLAASVT